MLAAMRYLEPSDLFQPDRYLNLCYLVASIVTERVSGQSWTEFTRARLTDKLRMNATFTVEDLAAAARCGRALRDARVHRLRAKLWPIRATAAGGINTSIASFANWLRLHLDRASSGTTASVADLDTATSYTARACQRTRIRRVR